MADPTPLCALAYLSFVSFINHHGDPATYAQSYDFAMFIATEASDIADRLRAMRRPERRGCTDH